MIFSDSSSIPTRTGKSQSGTVSSLSLVFDSSVLVALLLMAKVMKRTMKTRRGMRRERSSSLLIIIIALLLLLNCSDQNLDFHAL